MALQRLGLVPRRAHSHVALLVGCQDHRHGLRVVRRNCRPVGFYLCSGLAVKASLVTMDSRSERMRRLSSPKIEIAAQLLSVSRFILSGNSETYKTCNNRSGGNDDPRLAYRPCDHPLCNVFNHYRFDCRWGLVGDRTVRQFGRDNTEDQTKSTLDQFQTAVHPSCAHRA
jgi:hypothetical protein